METKMISVIVPIYNVMNYLQQCLESIIQQTYTNLESLFNRVLVGGVFL